MVLFQFTQSQMGPKRTSTSQSPTLAAAFSRNSDPSRIYLRRVPSERWPVWAMMARSGTPAEAAAVAGRFETAGRVGGVGRHGGGDRRQAGHLPAPAKRLEAGPVGAVRLDRILRLGAAHSGSAPGPAQPNAPVGTHPPPSLMRQARRQLGPLVQNGEVRVIDK